MTLEDSLRLYQQLLAKWPDRMPPHGHPDRDLWETVRDTWKRAMTGPLFRC
jgi:hypothetical protein